jgi:hypothetical protein
MRRIDQVETERDAVVQACDAGADTDALAVEPERESREIGELRGLGSTTARSWCAFLREFRTISR